jgi:hypothetical protein
MLEIFKLKKIIPKNKDNIIKSEGDNISETNYYPPSSQE